MLSTRYFVSQPISVCQGKVFFIGGTYDNDTSGCPAERYDPLINTWSPLESFKQRVKFCTVVTFQGVLYVMGGVEQTEDKFLSTVQRYNPDTNLWQVVSSLSSPRSSVCAVATRSYLYAIGGVSDVRYVNTVERYDPTLEKRVSAGGAAVNEKLFVFGGLKSEDYLHSSFCEMYDPVTDMWSNIANIVTAKGNFVSAVCLKLRKHFCMC